MLVNSVNSSSPRSSQCSRRKSGASLIGEASHTRSTQTSIGLVTRAARAREIRLRAVEPALPREPRAPRAARRARGRLAMAVVRRARRRRSGRHRGGRPAADRCRGDRVRGVRRWSSPRVHGRCSAASSIFAVCAVAVIAAEAARVDRASRSRDPPGRGERVGREPDPGGRAGIDARPRAPTSWWRSRCSTTSSTRR